MTRVLLTGASGFIATHILDILLAHGHSVRITVRSQDKADKLIAAHPEHKSNIDVAIVKDIAAPGAFDEAVKSDEKPFEAIIHTASPFHFNVTDTKKDLLDPAIQGTVGVLQAAKKNAPSVKRVVITSSFASIVDGTKGTWPEKTYTEADWNPMTLEDAETNPTFGYRASKTFAEKAAWEFVEKEKPNFDIATINPPMVFGPVKPYISSLDSMNTSNQRILNIIQGGWKSGLGPTGTYIWVDVRDVAEAHVAAMEKPEAGGNRFFIVQGHFSNQQLADIISKEFPDLSDKLPEKREENDGFPADGLYKIDNSRSKQILGLQYKSLNQSIVDLVKVLKEMGA